MSYLDRVNRYELLRHKRSISSSLTKVGQEHIFRGKPHIFKGNRTSSGKNGYLRGNDASYGSNRFPLREDSGLANALFWDTFTSHGDKPSCIEETTYNLCFGDPLCRRLQKLVGNDKIKTE